MLYFIVGFMGAGKSYFGRKWSNEFDLPLVDLDEYIEKKAGRTIAEIFSESGEDFFRALEAETLKAFKPDAHLLISCGGGAPCFHENMDWMNAHGQTIWLDASVDTIVENIKRDADTRPLLKNLKADALYDFIASKLAERKHFYHQAQHVVDVRKENTVQMKVIFSQQNKEDA